jgi:hypothetical protein
MMAVLDRDSTVGDSEHVSAAGDSEHVSAAGEATTRRETG